MSARKARTLLAPENARGGVFTRRRAARGGWRFRTRRFEHITRVARGLTDARADETPSRALAFERIPLVSEIFRAKTSVSSTRGKIARTVVVLAGDVTHVGVKELGRIRKNKRAVRGEGRRSSGVRLGAFREWRRE